MTASTRPLPAVALVAGQQFEMFRHGLLALLHPSAREERLEQIKGAWSQEEVGAATVLSIAVEPPPYRLSVRKQA